MQCVFQSTFKIWAISHKIQISSEAAFPSLDGEYILQLVTIPTIPPHQRHVSGGIYLHLCCFSSSSPTSFMYTRVCKFWWNLSFCSNTREAQNSRVVWPKPWLITKQRLNPVSQLAWCLRHHKSSPSQGLSALCGSAGKSLQTLKVDWKTHCNLHTAWEKLTSSSTSSTALGVRKT